jgi:hypothetical protein
MTDAYEFLTEQINNGTYVSCARSAHDAWKEAKERQGWTYGPRDAASKTNPLLVQYDALDAHVRGQNAVTPYAVMNFFRAEAKGRALPDLDTMLSGVQARTDEPRTQRMAEYVHSHFIAARLAHGDTLPARADLVVYESLDADTQSWDVSAALPTVDYLRAAIADYARTE